ncbi:hypothetical protein RclHR1_02690004 [Rhizophagus clarus]|nr:hypothetical protein RclHR1_02690003 [Rhizophagus clarus]GBB96119.1 hypothetical protein RclHR1_02690004 [Rhizophagus clarus]
MLIELGSIFDTVPKYGTFYALASSVWYGFHGNSREAAKSAVNAFQGSVGDSLLVAGFQWLYNNYKNGRAKREEIVNKYSNYSDTHECVFVSYNNDENGNKFKTDMENCFKEMWHLTSLYSISYSGKITYEKYLVDRMFVMFLSRGLINEGPVGTFVQWDEKSEKPKFNDTNFTKLEYIGSQISIHKKLHSYYYFSGNVEPLQLKNNTIFKYGKLLLSMKNIENETLASIKLTIDLAKNICKLIPYMISNEIVMVPSKNEKGANIVFKHKNVVLEKDSLFYLDYVSGRIIHVTTLLVLEVETIESNKSITLQLTNQDAEKKRSRNGMSSMQTK